MISAVRQRNVSWRPANIWHARLVAVIGASAAVAHVWMATDHSHGTMASIFMLAMAAGCIPCVVSMWRTGTEHAARMLMGMSLAMVLIHLALLLASHPAGHSGHHHTVVQSSAGSNSHDVVPMLIIMGVEYITAALCAVWLCRLRVNPASTGRGCTRSTREQPKEQRR